MNQNEKMTFGKHYLQSFANGIKRFTQSKWMVAIVNGFIAVMPIIITASIFTLLSALPEMVMTVMWQKEGPTAWQGHINYAAFQEYQTWAGAISNWSMGILGMLATAAIARNLAVELNNKLPFERRMNENMVFFAAICVYFMLSVIEFTVGSDDAWKAMGLDHTGRAIFVDGLAAQGILPGIIIGLTLPYVFYISYKRNWTIRLPKQVPQTISQAFLAIIPLFLTFAIYGSIGFGFNKLLGEPILFYIFEQIQNGLTGNKSINNSYGLFCIYTLMEGGFWFLGVHPEPVHAIMRATFWFDNIAANANGANNIFIEPLAYGYGAMGGSGCTLMLPLLCLICCRSDQMKITGKTAVVPIIFQVNEPALFGVPTILNPIFAFPMIFTGMINDVLFKAFADGFHNYFTAGTLYLPWSTPYFLQAALPTPTSWVPWVFNLIALAVCTLTYLPAVLIQDRQYLNQKRQELGVKGLNYNPINGFDIIKRKLFVSDPISKRAYKTTKKQLKNKNKKQLTLANNNAELSKQADKNYISGLLNAKLVRYQTELENLIGFYKKLFETKKEKINNKFNIKSEAVSALILEKEAKIKNKRNKIFNKIEAYKAKIEIYNAIIKTAQQKAKLDSKNKHLTKRVKKTEKHATRCINSANTKIWKYEAKLQLSSNSKVSIKKHVKDLNVYKKKLTFKAIKQTNKSCHHIFNKFNKKYESLKKDAKKQKVDLKDVKISNSIWKYKDIKSLKSELKTDKKNFKKQKKSIIKNNRDILYEGRNPWIVAPAVEQQVVASVTQPVDLATVKISELDPNKNYQVLVLCLGAGSSAVLANTINSGLKQKGITNIKAAALAWGQHESALPASDLVILSPQLGSHANNLSKQAEAIGFKLFACRGRDYIDLSKNPLNAAELIIKKLSE